MHTSDMLLMMEASGCDDYCDSDDMNFFDVMGERAATIQSTQHLCQEGDFVDDLFGLARVAQTARASLSHCGITSTERTLTLILSKISASLTRIEQSSI